MKAKLTNYRQSPRKVRMVAHSIKGKGVKNALVSLRFLPKRATHSLEKLLNSAISNAKENEGKKEDNLYVKDIRVDEGVTMRRFMPRARGRATRINKRTSNVTLELGEVSVDESAQKKQEKKKQVKK